MKNVLRINSIDNLVIALEDLKEGQIISDGDKHIELLEDVKAGHKIACKDIYKGEHLLRYGNSIGRATKDIEMGEWIHTHNLSTNLSGKLEYRYTPNHRRLASRKGPTSFKGYKRKNGSVGIRNELWIIPTVGCVNGVAEEIIREFKLKNQIDYSNIDNIQVYKHNFGCSQLGDDHKNTRTLLVDMVKHPNAGGVLVLGLGCENNTIDEFKKALGKYDPERTKFLITQDVADEIQEGLLLLADLYESMKDDVREELALSELKIGLKCGASDGFSGITANPLLGELSNYLVSHGGTTILTEVPEMFGAETILMDRAESSEVFNDIVKLINDFKEYFLKHNQPIYENPSPGNKEGGISTLEEKSLGCIQKGGSANIVDVLKYGEILSKNGLNLLYSPGNDLVASTALGASGCQMVLFTTGRGTPFGSFVPTLKIATNNRIFNLKPHWMDFNAGELLEGKSMDKLADEFIEYVVEVANGSYVNNEKNSFREIAIFKTGVTL